MAMKQTSVRCSVDVMDIDLDVLRRHLKPGFFKTMIKSREYYENRLEQFPREKYNYDKYIMLLWKILRSININFNVPHTKETSRLISKIETRIIFIFNDAVELFKDDRKVWESFILFLNMNKDKYTELLRSVLVNAIFLHGRRTDTFYCSSMELELRYNKINPMSQIQYICQLDLSNHKSLKSLCFKIFCYELKFINLKHITGKLNSRSIVQQEMVLTLHNPFALFEYAKRYLDNNSGIFYKMYKKTTKYEFASELRMEILRYMLARSIKYPYYWMSLAEGALRNRYCYSNVLQFRKSIDKLEEGVLINNNLWYTYVKFLLVQISTFYSESNGHKSNTFSTFQRSILKTIMSIHKRKKFQQRDYMVLIKEFKGITAKLMMKWAVETYPEDEDVLECCINKLIDMDKASAYEIFRKNFDKFHHKWFFIAIKLSYERTRLKDILSMVFADNFICSDSERLMLASKYLEWLTKNMSFEMHEILRDLRMNNILNVDLFKAIIKFEINQKIMYMNKIRTFLGLACEHFGNSDLGIWVMRFNFEKKYGTSTTLFTAYVWARKSLNEEMAEQLYQIFPPARLTLI